MSVNINTIFIGGLVSNLKETETKNGVKIAKFTITTWKRVKDKEDQAVFHDVVAYSNKAELILKHVSNKDYLIVDGEVDQFVTTEGKRISTVLLNEFHFVGNKKTA